MNNKLNKTVKVPLRYNPKTMDKSDRKTQKRNLLKSRKLYKSGIYYTRPKVKSFTSKKSPHIVKLIKEYRVKNAKPTKALAKKTKCKLESLNKIVEKGQGAYYSSGSRPNQTGHSWGYARLASALTGGNASVVDYKILKEGCKENSVALIKAKIACKKLGRNC